MVIHSRNVVGKILGVGQLSPWTSAIRVILVFLVSQLTFLSSPSFADYAPPSAWDLFGASSLIVEGTIVNVGKGILTVKVSQIVTGDYSKDTISIHRFENWMCGSRWTEYQEGQSSIFCLAEDKGFWTSRFYVIGGGNEGELPTVGGYAYYYNNYCGRDEGIPGASNEVRLVHGANLNCREFRVEEVVCSIRGFRRCFDIQVDASKVWFKRDHYSVKQLCSDRELQRYMDDSPFNRFLVESMRKNLSELK